MNIGRGMSRLLAVPFWIVEMMVREIAEIASYQQRGEIGARRKKKPEEIGHPLHVCILELLDTRRTRSARWLQVSTFSQGYFAHPLDFPERDC